MPSNYTTNYKLNQWARADRVLMEDFNADNAKIDAAIRAAEQRVDTLAGSKADAAALSALEHTVAAVSARAGSEVLASVTLAQEAGSVNLDLSGVDWSNYSVLVCLFLPSSSVSYQTPFKTLRVNGVSCLSVVFPMRSASTLVTGVHIYGVPDLYGFTREGGSFQSLTTISYNAISGSFGVGTTARVVGIH